MGQLPSVPSVTGVWRTADWHEREVYDLVGVDFAGHPNLVRILLADDWVGHDVAMPEPSRGRDGVRLVTQGYRGAFPDLKLTVDDQIAEGDRVCSRWTARGTHEGEFFGAPPTHKQATVTGVTIDRIRDGKIVESRTTWDALGLMQQLGLFSLPASSAAQS